MESFFARYRNLVVLLTLLVVQILGLAVQVHRTGSGHMSLDPHDIGGVRLIRLWANAVVSPPEQLIHSTGLGLAWMWNNYFDLRNVRQQNQQLQQTVDRLRLEEAALLEDARQGQRLQALLGFQERYIYKTVAAQVLGTSGSDLSRVFNIDKGRDDGIARDMAVVTPDGIVGKVRDVFPHSALVLAINDPTSGAGVILETTRTRGILRGNAAGQTEVVDIMSDQRIKPGETVLTAGGDLIFPRGLPVGVVEKVVPDPDRDSFIDVIVKPAAHLDQLDEVLVIASMEPRFPAEQKQDIATSEAQKGADVEELDAQKRASDIMAERLPGLLDPNLPADQQPLYDESNPNPIGHVAQPLHPDRFSPPTASAPGQATPAGTVAPKAEATPTKSTVTMPHKTTGTANPATPDQAQPQRKP